MTRESVFVSTTFAADGTSITEALAACVANGLRSVELGSNHAYEPDPIGVVERHQPLRCMVHNYFPSPLDPFVVNIASLNDDIYERSLAHVGRSIEFCRASGALMYTVHPGFLSDPQGPSRNSGNYDFLFPASDVDRKSYDRAYQRMLEALDWAVDRAAASGIRLAIETEGSVSKRDHLLLQRPDEFERLTTRFAPADLGVNLNIGHLRLASAAFGFEPATMVDVIADYIVAMELSHNDGVVDGHRPLQAGAWYWDLITDQRFAATYKILEFRNTAVADVAACADLVARSLCGF